MKTHTQWILPSRPDLEVTVSLSVVVAIRSWPVDFCGGNPESQDTENSHGGSRLAFEITGHEDAYAADSPFSPDLEVTVSLSATIAIRSWPVYFCGVNHDSQDTENSRGGSPLRFEITDHEDAYAPRILPSRPERVIVSIGTHKSVGTLKMVLGLVHDLNHPHPKFQQNR